MRYKTFRNLSLVGGLAVAGTLGYLGLRRCDLRPASAPVTTTPAPAAPTRPAAATTPAAATQPAAASAGAVPLRVVDYSALTVAKIPFNGDKKKDAVPGQPFKINLYKDAGKTSANRLKIDLDRDDKWDEKWTLEEGDKILRQVAPDDDEKYTEEWVRDGKQWVRRGGTGATGVAEVPASDGNEVTPLRPFDAQVLAMGDRVIPGDKVKDALPGPIKVSLYRDPGKSKVNRLKIDLDRDGKWDEKWTFEEGEKGPEVKRQMAPADDEQYTEEYRLRAGQWVRKR